MRHSNTKSCAFTLLELIIVIIIVSILTSLALPRMFNIIEGARASEAIDTIRTIRASMERCYLQHDGTYEPCSSGSDTPILIGTGPGREGTFGKMNLDIDDPSRTPGSHFFYDVITSSERPNSWAVCARRNPNVDPVFKDSMGVGDCYFICMGIGVKPFISGGEETGCFIRFEWPDNNTIYWGAEQRVSAFLPKNN